MTAPALAGVTVLDFATVGPAARASRMLSDYGATVVKIGAVPRAGGVQIEPPFYAYSGHRDMKRLQLDLKAPEGKAAFLRLAADADVVLESFRPGVVDRLGIGYDDVAAVNPDIVYCSTSGYGQTGPASQWAGHDINYLGLGGYLDCSERAPGDKPPLPGATVADAAGGGMQAAMAIMAALVRRATTGEGSFLDVSIADGVLVADGAVHRRVPGHRHRARARATTSSPAATPATTPTSAPTAGGWRSAPSNRTSTATSAGCSAATSGPTTSSTTPSRTRSGPPSGPPSPGGHATSGWPSWLRPTPASGPSTRSPSWSTTPTSPPVASSPRPSTTPGARSANSAPSWPAPTPPATEFRIRDGAVTDTDELLAAAGLTTDEIAALRKGGVVA